MKVLVSGATGFVGSELGPYLIAAGHQIIPLTRRPLKSNQPHIVWNPEAGQLSADEIEKHQIDGVVHLAGENIAGRWTASKKKRIHDSRIKGTTLLSETLAKLRRKPEVLVSASAIGYYGTRGDELLTERSGPGRGFLSEVCQAWESATTPAHEAGIRVVNTRFGMVLSPRGGALKKMVLPFKLFLGGVIGSGNQYWSWVTIDDAVSAIRHAIYNNRVRGPLNVVSPYALTNAHFTQSLGSVLARPAPFPMPESVARLVFGEMADALLLASARVKPEKLMVTDYKFIHPNLEGALHIMFER